MIFIFVYLILPSTSFNNTSHKRRSLQNNAKSTKTDEELEMALRHLERSRLNIALTELKLKDIVIAGFYHTSKWKSHWESVITEQLRLLDGSRYKNAQISDKWGSRTWSSLLHISEQLFLNVAGSTDDFGNITALVNSLNLRNKAKVVLSNSHTLNRDQYRYSSPEVRIKLRIKANAENLSEGEFSTISNLHNYCKEKKSKGKKAFIFYMHSKGGCCPKTAADPVSDWRDEMNAFNIEFPSTCIRALLQGYVGCGVEYQDTHYSGNFWWADCDHIAALPGLWDPIDNAYACEYFMYNVSNDHSHRHNFAKACGYNMYHCNVNHYDSRCPREKYLPRLLQLLSSPGLTLPPNPTANNDRNNEWASKHCPKVHMKPYMSQPSWFGSEDYWWNLK